MKRLTIVIPYYNRPQALARLNNSISFLSKEFYDIIISEVLTESSGKFNTAKAFNEGIDKAKTEWILKNDVDCIAENPESLYQHALLSIQNMSIRNYKIYGAKYLKENGELSNFHQCGNEILCSKRAWDVIGRVPEWEGYGFEDYAFEYLLEKNSPGSDFNVPYFQKPRQISNYIRDNLVKKKNQENINWFNHHWHEPVFISKMVQQNLKNLWELVMKKEGHI